VALVLQFPMPLGRAGGQQDERRDNLMTKRRLETSIALSCTLFVLVGCHTGWNRVDFITGPVTLYTEDVIVRDQIIILVDVTGSIGFLSQYEYEMDLMNNFIDAMPDGFYDAGIDSFAGMTRADWVERPLAPYDRARIEDGAASIRPLGSTTPLAEAIQMQKDEVQGLGGRGALLVFSDGEVLDPQEVQQACRDLKAAHGGEFCIYTVLIGDDRQGRKLMKAMAREGCGKYYDGATLTSPDAFEAMARDIFLGQRANQVSIVSEATVEGVEVLPMNLRNILFDNDKSYIRPEYNGQLNEIAAIMERTSAMRLRLDGHTDHNASNAYNQELSERRVNAVKAALMERGVEGNRLSTGAHGEEDPTVPNSSPQNLQLNRRVELTVVD
jgi:OOP family OmpA-OmpF porin